MANLKVSLVINTDLRTIQQGANDSLVIADVNASHGFWVTCPDGSVFSLRASSSGGLEVTAERGTSSHHAALSIAPASRSSVELTNLNNVFAQ